MRKMQIKAFNGKVLFKSKAKSTKELVEKAVAAHIDLCGADLDCANLSYANFRNANISYANLSGANLRGADFHDANLGCTNFRGADLRGANLNCANLRGTDLNCANLGCADLSYTNLSYANLRGTDLGCTDLSYTNLRGTDLTYANFRGTDLRGADIRGFIINITPVQILGLEWDISLWDTCMQIGCELHSYEDWKGFTDKQILVMADKEALTFWKTNKATLLNMGKVQMKKGKEVVAREMKMLSKGEKKEVEEEDDGDVPW